MGLFERRRQPPGPTPDARRLRAAPLERLTLSSGEALLFHPATGRTFCLPHSLAAVLLEARALAALPEHAARLAEELALDEEGREALAADLATWAGEGLLLDEAAIRAGLLAHAAPEPAPITRAHVLTRDRPAELARCLTSLAPHLAGRALVIHDDSRSGGPGEVGRCTRADRRAWLQVLARAGAHRELLEFALLGGEEQRTTGATMNAALLCGTGELLLGLDDDVHLRLGDRRRDAGLALSSTHDPTHLELHADRARALAAARLAPADAFALHEAALGRGIGALAHGSGSLHLQDLDGAALGRLLDHGGVVRVSALGLAGDSGMGSSAYYLSRRGPSRESLLSDYAAHRSSRAVIRSVERLTISTGRFLMTACVGLDARALLPPFFPLLRNPDGLFGGALRALDPGALIAHLPQVIAHEPEPRAHGADALFVAPTTTRMDEILFACLDTLPSPATRDVEQRLQRYGAHLHALGALPLPEFRALVWRDRARRLAAQVDDLEALLAEHGAEPAAWAADARRMVEALSRALESPALIEPRDLPAEGLAGAQRLVGRYGRLLIEWPGMVSAARSLRAAGAPLLQGPVPG